MTRVLFLSPERTDADVRRHAELIANAPGVSTEFRPVPPGERLAETLRLASQLYHRRHSIDVVVTVGSAALSAATIGWRGPTVHIAAGALRRSETNLVRWISTRDGFRLVTSSPSVARKAIAVIADTRRVIFIRPDSESTTLTMRKAVREKLGVPASAPLYHVVGHHRRGSGHRLGLWTTSILVFRDPATRVSVSLGGERDDFIGRFALSTQQAQSLVADENLTEADLAASADVAICAAEGPPDYTALKALADRGTPIIALQSTWAREQLAMLPATLVAEPRARLLAAACLAAFNARIALRVPVPQTTATNPWIGLLASLAR